MCSLKCIPKRRKKHYFHTFILSYQMRSFGKHSYPRTEMFGTEIWSHASFIVCSCHFFAICVSGALTSKRISSWMFISCSACGIFQWMCTNETASLMPHRHLHQQVLPLLLSCFSSWIKCHCYCEKNYICILTALSGSKTVAFICKVLYLGPCCLHVRYSWFCWAPPTQVRTFQLNDIHVKSADVVMQYRVNIWPVPSALCPAPVGLHYHQSWEAQATERFKHFKHQNQAGNTLMEQTFQTLATFNWSAVAKPLNSF